MSRRGLVETINHPLGFFVLGLLIVESFLGTVLIGSDLEPMHKYYGMWAGIGLFIILIIAVFILVWFKPKNLTFGEEGYLRDKGTFGTESNPLSEETINKDKKTGSGEVK